MTPSSTPQAGPAEGSRHSGHVVHHHSLRIGIAALAVGLFGLAGCSATSATPVSIPPGATGSAIPPATATPAPFPLTLTGDDGEVLSLASAPQKIVSLTPATTETLFALGAGSRVIATDNFDDYPPEAVALPDVATYQSVDVEKIVSMGADLVIAGGNGFTSQDAIDQLRRLKVPVLVVYAKDVKGVLHDIELVGDGVGAGPAARDLTVSMQAGIDQISAATAALPKPRTFYEIDATKEIYGPAKSSFVAEMVSLAGGKPITTDDPAVFSISLEKLVAADPEVIVLGDAAYGVTSDIVTARPGWGTMTAVVTQQIRPANDILITRPGPRLVAGLRDLAIAIHPELASVLPASSPSPSPSGWLPVPRRIT